VNESPWKAEKTGGGSESGTTRPTIGGSAVIAFGVQRWFVGAAVSLALAVTALVAGCSPGAQSARAGGDPARAAAVPAASPPLLVAVGDLACSPETPRTAVACHQAATSALALRLRPAAVALLGDTQYQVGALSAYRQSFAPTWGRLRPRLHPAVGNHEYLTADATDYFTYFGRSAGPRGRGYYSYNLGAWHLIVLNSNCLFVSCRAGSPQERWLRADLAAHRNRCVLAYWHHPRFTSGFHGNTLAVAPLWNALYRAGADLVLTGHDHDYERFAPQTPSGRRDPVRGIREFVVGTGGVNHYRFVRLAPNSERRSSSTFGVLALTLRPGGYSWRFVPEPGALFTDAGSDTCH
jgi:acid phosphatase type 7